MPALRKIFPPILLLFSAILTACASSDVFQYVEQDYRGRQQSSVSVIIAPVLSEIVPPGQREAIFNRKNEKKRMLSTKEISLFSNYMPPILSDYTQAAVIEPDQSFKFPDFTFTLENFTTEDGQKISLYVPAKSDKLKYNDEVPNYILFTEDLYFNKNMEEQSMSIGRGSSSSFLLEGGIEYLLWDNSKGRVAAYGSLQKGLQLFGMPGKEEYLLMLDFFASSIIKNSPLAFKEIRY